MKIDRLIWDPWNVAHIAEHQVTPEEVEEICQADPLVEAGHTGRILVIGLNKAGRLLTAVLDPEPEQGVYYVVSARAAARKERVLYRAQRGGEEQ